MIPQLKHNYEKYNKCKMMIDVLKYEYTNRITLIKNTMLHVERLNIEHIISLHENSRHMKSMNDILKVLNCLYNNSMNKISCSHENIICDVQDDLTDDLWDIKNIDTIIEKYDSFVPIEDIMTTINMIPKNNENAIRFCDFTKIDNMIIAVFLSIGGASILDVIKLYINVPHKLLFNDTDIDMINILADLFVPLSVMESGEKCIVNKKITIINGVRTSNKYEILLDNFYKVSFFGIDIFGYFNNDCIHIYSRTSQICDRVIYKKRSEFLNSYQTTKRTTIPYEFKEMHINNLTIGALLSHTKTTYNELLANDYVLFQKYSNISFKQLFEEFMQSNLENKFKIIKILLFSSSYFSTFQEQNNVANYAGLLYGLVKESKTGTTVISDVIYKNLDLQSRLKLSKTGSSIKYEIDKLNNIDIDDIDLKKQLLLNPNIPDRIRKIVLMKINEMKSSNSEYYKQLTYVKSLIDYPWIGKNDSDMFTMYQHDIDKKREILINIKNKLGESVYGHSECKDTIMELIGKWFSNPKSMGKAIGLEGPPGVGKTLIAKKLGESLGIPFTQINLGGMEDGSVLSGHSITYSGAVPGLIVKKMIEAGKPRCIIFFDELDKTSCHHGKNEIYDTLIHVIDSTTNAEFSDKFFQEVKFPINKVLFVFSFNDKDKIDRILLDRIDIVKVDAYTPNDKINIINKYLIKDLKDEYGMNDIDISISEEDALYLIDSFTAEAGVRSIKRKLEKIFSKLNMDKIMGTGPFTNQNNITNFTITNKIIEEYMTKSKITTKKINSEPKIGNVNGLYATTLGTGGIIPILMYCNHNENSKFELKLTGKQGETMKESVHFAYTIATNLAIKHYRDNFIKKYFNGVHIHTPDGATPKDGPSAGSAFTLCFMSLIFEKKIKNDIGLTGEIDQDGTISAIGGLEYKLPGAKKAGIKFVFVPKENEKDIEKLKISNNTLFDDEFKYMLVEKIGEILDYALIDVQNYTTFDKSFDHTKYLVSH